MKPHKNKTLLTLAIVVAIRRKQMTSPEIL